jgi:excisionase family DNA binding protein
MTEQKQEDRWVDIKELCQIFGVSKHLVYKMSERGQIPHTKWGKLLRFNVRLVEETLMRGLSQNSHDV